MPIISCGLVLPVTVALRSSGLLSVTPKTPPASMSGSFWDGVPSALAVLPEIVVFEIRPSGDEIAPPRARAPSLLDVAITELPLKVVLVTVSDPPSPGKCRPPPSAIDWPSVLFALRLLLLIVVSSMTRVVFESWAIPPPSRNAEDAPPATWLSVTTARSSVSEQVSGPSASSKRIPPPVPKELTTRPPVIVTPEIEIDAAGMTSSPAQISRTRLVSFASMIS